MAELIFTRRGEEVMFYHLDGKKTKIGRGVENDISFPEHEVNISRYHAMVEERLGMFWLHDLSDQGLLVNDKPKSEAILQDGDNFALGRWKVIFRSQQRGSGKTLMTRSRGTIPLASEDQLLREVSATLSFEQDGIQRTEPLDTGSFNIGSNPENDLCLDLPYISSFHCRIFQKNGLFFIRDLDSLNGLWVNGSKTIEAELTQGAEIYVGKFKIVFTLEHEADDVNEEQQEWPGFAGMISEDPKMQKVFRLIERMAASDVSVLIHGESGTGKELVARALHTAGSRTQKPFVALNCGSISRDLIESALFGHERGAFTGAIQERKGAFEEAADGTLFLDEIGDMPFEQQVSLLRVLESRTFRRMGGSQDLESRARIVTATHKDLVAHSQTGLFREDLFYRISVLQIQLPPLRERPGDILLLARFFLHKFAGPRGMSLSPEAEQRLIQHTWPGNVRELHNTMQNAIVMADGNVIQADELVIRAAPVPQATSFVGLGTASSGVVVNEPSSARLDDTERQAILRALDACNGVVSDAAKRLGIGRSSMYSKMKRLGIEHRKKV